MSNFLHNFYRNTNKFAKGKTPISQDMHSDTVRTRAIEICNAFGVAPERAGNACYRLVLSDKDGKGTRGDGIPEFWEILDTTDKTLTKQTLSDLFGLRGADTWGDIKRTQQTADAEADPRWVTEFRRAIQHAAEQKWPPYVIQSKVRSHSGRMFRPELFRVDWSEGLALGAHILFFAEGSQKEDQISWEEYWDLLCKIASLLKKNGEAYRPDVIISLSHGGMAYGDFLVYEAYEDRDRPGESAIPHVSLWVDRSSGKPVLDNPVNRSVVTGLKQLQKGSNALWLLVVDDYVVTGETVRDALDYLKKGDF